VIANDDIGFAILEFVRVGKANPCSDQTQASDEGSAEDVHASFVSTITKAIVANPLYDMKHEEYHEKGHVIDYS
tara:strand:+ start:227 stop:448 length:222 start_codon:yes stop_codon:yes gene_type:complete